MANLNITINLTQLPGAKVMDIKGKTCTKQCVVIPIDNKVGTVCDGYTGKGPDGQPTPKFFDDVKLNLVGIEYKARRYGATHGIKAQFSKEQQEQMTEEQMRDMPWLGNVKPWAVAGEAAKTDDIGDLPEDDNDKDW